VYKVVLVGNEVSLSGGFQSVQSLLGRMRRSRPSGYIHHHHHSGSRGGEQHQDVCKACRNASGKKQQLEKDVLGIHGKDNHFAFQPLQFQELGVECIQTIGRKDECRTLRGI